MTVRDFDDEERDRKHEDDEEKFKEACRDFAARYFRENGCYPNEWEYPEELGRKEEEK